MVNYIGLALLFGAIIYSGKKVGDYFKLRRELGELVLAVTPSKGQKKFLLIAGVVFILLLAMVTYSYTARGVGLNVSYTLLLSAVIFSTGRFMDSVTELRAEGMLGKLDVIKYGDIQSYTYTEQGRRQLVKFQLKTRIEFTAIISVEDKEALDKAIKTLKNKA